MIREQAAEYPPEKTARTTGIEAATVRELVREFMASPAAVCYGRMVTCIQEFGTLTNWLIIVFNIITGKFDRPKGFMFATPALDLVALTARVNEQGRYPFAGCR